MVRLKQWLDDGKDLVFENMLGPLIRMDGISLHQVGYIPNPFQKTFNEDHTQVLGNSRIGGFKSIGKLLTEVRRHLHPQQNWNSPRLAAHDDHFAKISVQFSDTDPSEPIVTTQLNDHNVRLVFLNQARQPHQTSSGCIARYSCIQDLMPPGSERCSKKSYPAIGQIRQAIARTDAVPKDQYRRSLDRK